MSRGFTFGKAVRNSYNRYSVAVFNDFSVLFCYNYLIDYSGYEKGALYEYMIGVSENWF